MHQKQLNVLESKTNSTPKTKFLTSPKPSPFEPIPTHSTLHVQQHFGPTKSLVINNNIIPQYFQKNNLRFDHQGDEFYLQDKEFIKNLPKIQPPDTEEEALTIYSQLQKNAIIYNIFITPIDKITIWDHSPTSIPTTCKLTTLDTKNISTCIPT